MRLSAKDEMWLLSLASLAMGVLCLFMGAVYIAIPCLFGAGLGALIALFGFKKGLRYVCDGCGDTESANGRSKQVLQTSLRAKGWHIDDEEDLCPECVEAERVKTPVAVSTV